jgi:hypothetical protein
MKRHGKRPRATPRRLVVETLEARILYSADFAPGLLDAAPVVSDAEQCTLEDGGELSLQAGSEQLAVSLVPEGPRRSEATI